MKFYNANFYYWYTNPHNAYMGDVFNGYQNLFHGTLNVVVHEWAPDLNIGLENLSFQIVGTSIIMHSSCLETFICAYDSCNFLTYHQQCAKIVLKL